MHLTKGVLYSRKRLSLQRGSKPDLSYLDKLSADYASAFLTPNANVRWLLAFNEAILFRSWIVLHDVTCAVKAIFRECPQSGFSIVVVTLEYGWALQAQLARPITGVLAIRTNEPIKNVSV